MIEQFSRAIREGAVIVTANQRLARFYRRLYNDHQLREGARAWEQPSIVPWNAWVRRLWEDAVLSDRVPHATVLSKHQAEAVWHGIVADSPAGGQLLQMRATAASAMSAWKLLQQYRVSWKRIAYGGDWEAFAGWARAFEQVCVTEHWLDEPRVANVVMASGGAPQTVLLGGFDEFTPQQGALLEALQGWGGEWHAIERPEVASTSVTRSEWIDAEAELRAAALWARSHVQEGSNRRIAVVVPDLGALRSKAQRIFTEVLHPHALASFEDLRALFHLSTGVALASYPLVHSALMLLRIGGGELLLNEAGAILRSPFIAGAMLETSGRAQVDARLRRTRAAEIGIDYLRQEASRIPVFAEALNRWGALQPPPQLSQKPSAWAASFRALLEAIGWPGDRVLSSAEFQTRQAWEALLDNFESLDLVEGMLARDEAFDRLAAMAEKTEFQPEDPNAAVQVTGALEAAGADFDHLWITGLDHEAWPAPARPHPFVPPAVQVEYNMPHSSPQRESEFAVKTLARLMASAPEVMVSHARRQGERVLRPSPFIAALPALANALVDPPVHAKARTVLIDDSSGPGYTDELVRGGTSTLKHQSQCPFRAFAQIRLGARPLEHGALGVTPADRGSALHKALDVFWKQTKSHNALLALTAEALDERVRECAQAALGPEHGSVLSRRFLKMEKQRVAQVLIEWLELEKTRAPFTVVQGEQDDYITMGGLKMKTRIDRLDELASGGLVVIDYKSTAPSVNAWEPPRMDEPQVPLYATSLTERVAGVAFGQLTPADMRFRGCAEAGVLPGIKGLAAGETIAGRIEEWRASLTVIAGEFRTGHAAVKPTKNACAFCGLTAFCRITEVHAEERDA